MIFFVLVAATSAANHADLAFNDHTLASSLSVSRHSTELAPGMWFPDDSVCEVPDLLTLGTKFLNATWKCKRYTYPNTYENLKVLHFAIPLFKEARLAKLLSLVNAALPINNTNYYVPVGTVGEIKFGDFGTVSMTLHSV